MSPVISSSDEEEEDDGYPESWMEMMKIIESLEKDVVYSRSCCEKCKHVQQSYGKKIIPEKLSRGRLQAQLEGEGTFECAVTGLIFEASERVLVVYTILSWYKFSKFVHNPWIIAGPIFNVETVDQDPSALKSIKMPHSLCLAGQGKEKVFGVLHVTGKDPVIQRVQSSGSHVTWPVSSLSPVGVIARNTQQDENHGVVLLYEDLGGSMDTHCFRVFLSCCNSSHVKDLKKSVKKRRFVSVDTNTFCLLVEEKYHLMSEPRGDIDPGYLPFTLEPLEFRGFFEAYFEQPPPFKLILKVHGSDVTTWTATIRQGDLVASKLQVLLGPPQLGSSE